MLNFFDRLKEERKRLGLNQMDVAKHAGVSKTTQFNYEKGDRQPDSEYLAAVAELGMDISYLVTGSRSLNLDLNKEESALLDNFRHLGVEDKKAIYHVSLAMAVGSTDKKAGNE
ncbi:MAG: hypothetical protein AXW15_05805 [Neptuniibacter sp. Phe_28]|jgi:transcriptional regulator with XRE-family HTH domain|nr:MAG: hypothetical protein AXW15_05805 [Neptuniibacter sp. Phe_28]